MTQKPATPALVSATLAQVYIQQDHLEQARRMLARVLQADPLHGHALALRDRLQARSRARLYAGYRPGRGLAVRWHDAPELPDLHLVAAIFRPIGRPIGRPPVAGISPEPIDGAASVYVTSVACRSSAGEHGFTLGGEARGPATATLCLARWDGARLLPVAVHEPLSW
jgi:hypothetical protein